MKSVWCTVWILGAVLVIATLDARPDPPAVNPNPAAHKVLQTHDCACDTATPRCDSLAAVHPFTMRRVATGLCEPHRPSDRIILTGQAGDPSPPLRESLA
jgi:hypothetical protein